MTNILNINSIDINGNEVDRIALNFNPYNRTKKTTLLSQQALEEAIDMLAVKCDYDFMKKHLDNVTFRNVQIDAVPVYSSSEITNVDNTYGMTIVSESNVVKSLDLSTVKTKYLYIPSVFKYVNSYRTMTVDTNGIALNLNFTAEGPKEIIIDDDVKITSFTNSTTGVIDIYYNGFDFTNGTTLSNCNIHFNDSYTVAISTGTFNLTCQNLYLDERFFTDDTGFVKVDTATAGSCGNWSGVSTVSGKIYVDASCIYTTCETEDALKTRLETLLQITDTTKIVITNFEETE